MTTEPSEYNSENTEKTKIDEFGIDYDQINPSIKKSQPRNTGQMTTDQCKKVIDSIIKKFKLENTTQAMILISGLCQVGGTNRNAGGKVTYTYTYGAHTLKATDLSTSCEEQGGTPRQFARTMGTTIANIAIKLNEPGDLSRQMRMELPNISESEAIWCSNFQTQNSDCPQRVQTWLKENFQKRFEN